MILKKILIVTLTKNVSIDAVLKVDVLKESNVFGGMIFQL